MLTIEAPASTVTFLLWRINESHHSAKFQSSVVYMMLVQMSVLLLHLNIKRVALRTKIVHCLRTIFNCSCW